MSQAFDLTLKDFEIKASEFAVKSGVSESDISRFRNGKTDVGYQKVQKLLSALSPLELDYFWLLFRCNEPELARKISPNFGGAK
jgi:transcriptional regulator with XRE-family HTH domain